MGLVELHLLLLHDSLNLGMFLSNDLQQVLGEYLCPLYLTFIRAATRNVSMRNKVRTAHLRYVDVHRLVVLMSSVLVDEAGTETLNLHPSVRLLLDVFDKHTLMKPWSEQNQDPRRHHHLPEAQPPSL